MSTIGVSRHLWGRILVVTCSLVTLGYVLSDTLGLSEGLFDLPLVETEQADILPDDNPVVPEVSPDIPPVDLPVYSMIVKGQSPTDLLGSIDDLTLSEYTCDPSEIECRMNLLVTPLVDGVASSAFTCEITSDFEIVASASGPCNPNTSIVTLGDHILTIKILQKSDGTILQTRDILLKNPPIDTTIDPLRVTSVLEWQQTTHLLLKEDTARAEYTCDPEQIDCKINLQFTPLLDGIPSSRLTCAITSDFEIIPSISDPCNPNTSIVPVGNHTLTIKILQTSDNTLLQTREILLKNPSIDTTIDPLRVTSALEWQQTTHLLLKDDTSLPEYTCDPEQTECRINLLVSPFLDGIPSSRLTCAITSDFEIIPSVSDPCNPNTSLIPTGDHILTIKILQASDNSVLQTREILLKNPLIDTSIHPSRVSTMIAWQSPTYLLLKEDTTLSEYTCDPTHSECRINLLVTPLLDGVASSRLTCGITSDFPLEPTTDICNPNTSLVPLGEHILTIKILQKSDNLLLHTRQILLKHPATTGGSSGGSGGVSALDLSASKIITQSGLDPDGRCRSDTCQANFLAEVPANAVCRWDFGTGIFETVDTNLKCNPGYVKFPFDTNVTLTVSDPNNPVNQAILTLRVYHEKTPFTSSSPQAQIDIQGVLGKNKRLVSGGILCEIGNDDACSLNFTGEKSINAKRYFWDFGNQVTSDKENPSAQKYPLGKYIVRLVVTNDLGVSAEAYYEIEVVKKFDILPEKICLNCAEMVGKIQISAVLPNPPHADTVEWIELKNLSSETWNLDTCILSDEAKEFALSETIGAGKTLRFRQIITGLSLGNTKETLELRCGDILVDTFSWDFEVPSGYILRRDMLDIVPVQVGVINVVDGDTIDVMLRNKKTRIRLLGVDTPETVHPQKAVEKFGKEASDFTKKVLNGKTVWMTFDHEILDHYGRTLAYIWECEGGFDTTRCTMFNSRIVSEGYGRMERRFEFLYYDEFNTLEGIAKKAKIGIWSDPEVAKALDDMSDLEAEKLKKEQEEEYLRLQKELLELEKLKCKEDGTCEDILSWAVITENMSTLSVRANTSGALTASGRTWGDFPVRISFFLGDVLVYTADTMTDSVGEYEVKWYPKVIGEYRVEATFQNPEPLPTDAPEDTLFKLEKNIIFENISNHFLAPLAGKIVLQGTQGTKNRWIGEDGVFHCLSRGSCSVNLTAEVNRKKDIRYEWILPDGSVSVEKNPPALKLVYGDYTATLKVVDEITGENVEVVFSIRHRAIPKALKKAPSPSSKYTIDLKDATLDTGGGVMPEKSPVGIGGALLTIFLLSLSSFALFGKQSKIFIDK